jgi:2-phosphosulfolactate phosphatase
VRSRLVSVAIVRPEDPAPQAVDVCIVVDVLRATTTAAVLCERLGGLCVLPSAADLVHLPARAAGYALFSELKGLEVEVPRFDNSPVQARRADLAGRMPVLATTNGTVAVGIAARFAREVVLGSFINASAVAAHVRASGAARVAVMPAGNIGKAQRCSEDDGCAESLVAMLRGTAMDTAAVIAACRADPRILRRSANEPGLADDIALCFDLDAIAVAPRVSSISAQRWFAVERA